MAARARVVGISDLIKVIECLEKNGFPEDQWFGLGLELGIIYVKLKEIEANNPSDAKACLRECLTLWLQWDYDIDQYGKPTMESLAAAVREMGLNVVAEGILHNFDKGTALSSSLPLTEPITMSTGVAEATRYMYAGLVIYEDKDIVRFIAIKAMSSIREFVKRDYPHVQMEISFSFDNTCDYVELDFNAPQEEPFTGWTIKPHTKPCRLYRRDIDNFGKANYSHPPSCLVSVYESPSAVPTLKYAVPLVGVAKPLTLYICRSLKTAPSESDINKSLRESTVNVELTVTRVTMCGLPGTGKTCAQNLLLNKDPPFSKPDVTDPFPSSGDDSNSKPIPESITDSTPIACPTIRATRVSADGEKWKEVTRKKLLHRLAYDLKNETSKKSANDSEVPQLQGQFDQSVTETHDITASTNTPENVGSVIKEVVTTYSEKGFKKKEEWLYIIDSGGQPAYQELLPLFTRAASLNIITIDLSKGLEEELELKYRIDGKYFHCHSKSTQLACFKSAVSSGTIFEPLDIPEVTAPSRSMHFVLGTHCDKIKQDKLILYEETLQKSVSSLESYLRDCVIYKIANKSSMIHPVNTLATGEDREHYSQELCDAIQTHYSDASLTIKVPIRWFAFELALPEKSIITIKEALDIGAEYGMNKENTKQALQYLHNVTLILYYPEVLDVVFSDPRPILEILSQLLALTYIDNNKALKLITADGKKFSQKEDITNLKKGFFKKELLDKLKSSSMFTAKFDSSHLIKLLCHLNIICCQEQLQEQEQQKEQVEYFIPYALPSHCKTRLEKKSYFPKPLCILYWTEEGKENQNLPIPQGVFPLAIVYLLNQKKVKIPEPKNRTYMYRDAMTLLYEANIFHMINQYSHIEVHYIGPKENCPDIRKLVFEAITDGSAKINCKRDYIHLGFTCKHDEIIIIDKKGNRKTPCSSTELSCSLDDDTYKCWFNENATSPGVAQTDIKDNDSQEHKRSTTKRLASVRNIENETVNEETNYPHPKRSCNISDIMKKEPKDADLFVVFKDYENQYTLIGSGLDVNVAGIRYDPEDPTECLRLVFWRWKQKNRNVTWEKIEQICKKFPDRLGKVHSNLQKYLSSDDA